MRYLGGKVRQAKRITECVQGIARTLGRKHYREPFVGGGSIFAEACGRYERSIATDVQEDLIRLWQAVADGWLPPQHMDRETYEQLRHSEDPSALRAWAAFAVSFNGKRWAGYGPSAAGRDYVAESFRSTVRKGAAFRAAGANFECLSFETITPTDQEIVYCDPPYEDTTGYGCGFDHATFWAWAEHHSRRGVPIVVSEYRAPEGWVVIDSWSRAATVDATKTTTRSELLMVHESIAALLTAAGRAP